MDVINDGWYTRKPEDFKMWEIFLITAEAAGIPVLNGFLPTTTPFYVKWRHRLHIEPLYLTLATHIEFVEFEHLYELMKEKLLNKVGKL